MTGCFPCDAMSHQASVIRGFVHSDVRDGESARRDGDIVDESVGDVVAADLHQPKC